MKNNTSFVVILSDNYTEYQRRFIDPLCEKLKALGYGTIVVTGHELSPSVESIQPSYDAANEIYSVVSKYDAAGVICFSGCLGHNLTASEINTFVSQFTHLPLVSLGADIKCANSVSGENFAGMKKLMLHLTENPDNKKYVFIRGFENDGDSLERESVFRNVLNEKGIAVADDHFLTGNYIPIDAYAALDQLLSRSVDIDVVVAANDDMAAAAMRVLNKYGLDVPGDVRVCGFDNSPKSRETSPPLTTVGQPSMPQVDAVIARLHAQIKGTHSINEISPCEYASGELVIRASTTSTMMDSNQHDYTEYNSIDDAIAGFFEHTFQLEGLKSFESSAYDYRQMSSAIEHTLKYKSAAVKNLLQELRNNPAFNYSELGWWKQYENMMNLYVRNNCDRKERYCLVPQLIPILADLQEFNWTMKQQQQFDIQKSHLLQTRLQVMVSKCDSVDKILEILGAYFRKCGISRAFFIQYESSDAGVDCAARLRWIYRQDSTLNIDMAFESHEILPGTYHKELYEGTLVLSPLFTESKQFGYLLVDENNSSLSLEYIGYTISQAIHNLELVASLKQANSALEYFAHTDSLTGLSRRDSFEKNLNVQLNASRDTSQIVCLIYLDLDGLKTINDTHGHHVGDLYLCAAADRIKAAMRPGEAIARMGGDEFAIFIPSIRDQNHSRKIAQRILDRFRAPMAIENKTFTVSASLGIAHYPADGQSVSSLIQCADSAMYHAKKSGKNRIASFSDSTLRENRSSRAD